MTRHRPPLGEDQGGERDIALAGRHVLDEAGDWRDRQIGAGEAAEDAGSDDGAVAQPATEMPAVSTAPGFSPTARSRRPKRVR